MADDLKGDMGNPDKTAKLRAVRQEADRLGGDVKSLGRSLMDLVEAQTREKPLQTVAIALSIGWFLGRRV
ncbi:MAG: hypothetical protein JWO51_849 [Rhodospirillales bacterium]|nr:hypothetical protein [Rhodospirillales bacterium]